MAFAVSGFRQPHTAIRKRLDRSVTMQVFREKELVFSISQSMGRRRKEKK